MKLPQQVGPMRDYVTATMPLIPLGGVTASPWVDADPTPGPRRGCSCVPNGNFLVPRPGGCALGGYARCYNNGTCACVDAPPPNGGIAQNKQHVYNAIGQLF